MVPQDSHDCHGRKAQAGRAECPHCHKTIQRVKLKAHIISKHMPDSEKPFRCKHCPRGEEEGLIDLARTATEFFKV